MSHVLAFAAALLVGSAAEYAVHWSLHRPRLFKRFHAKHHAQDTSWAWPLEACFVYLPMASPFLLLTPWLGWGWVCGVVVFCCALPWCHHRAHAEKDVPWMRQHIHILHHDLPGWRGNYGVTNAFWDKCFRTFKDA